MECDKDFNTRDCKSVADVKCASAPSHPIKTSFWTQCSTCQMKFEHLICHSNKRLRCRNPSCRKPYVAIDIPPPPTDGNSPSNSKDFSEAQPCPNRIRNDVYASVGRQTSPTNAGSTSFSGIHLPEKLTSSYGTLTRSASDEAARATASYSTPSGMLEPIVQHQKRDREEAAAAVKEKCSKRIQMSKKARSDSVGTSSDVNSLRKGRLEDRRRVNFGVINQFNSLKNLSLTETRKMLIDKAKTKILKKLNERSSENELANGLNSSQRKVKVKYSEEHKAPAIGAKTLAVKHRKPVDGKDKVHIKGTYHGISNVESEAENIVFKQMLVADPDFHDFDIDRTEVSFADNQVWAAYDDDDGMPRYYALIHKVIKLKPFEVLISWLTSKSNRELGPMRWVGSGFAKTCGDLRIGKSVAYGSLNAFSHTMRWTKDARGLIQIYPLKGDVWALYRKWSSDWNESTPKEVIHSYDMVEVIEDYSEDHGAIVAPLIKVCGFKTVFRKHPDPCKLWTIPRKELFRFSHQVPSHLLTSEGAANAPIGCWELDPASTPLQVVTQGQGGEKEGPADTINELAEYGETDGKELDGKMDEEANEAVNRMKPKL